MNNEVNKIISVYTTILENKSILKEFDTVRLADTNYSNVKFDNDATRNDSVNQALLDDIQQAAANVGIVATITTAKSGHKEKTKSGYTSRHMSGAGVDIALLNGVGSGGASNSSNGSSEFRALGNKLKDSLVSMGYTWNTESGNPKAVLWQTDTGGNHYNHLHVSNNSEESSVPTDSVNSKDSVNLGNFGDVKTDTVTSTTSNTTSSDASDSVKDIGSITPDPLITTFAKKLAGEFKLGVAENINRIKRLL
jgi:hypothetical protein